MGEKAERILFLGRPGRKHWVVELEQQYTRRELAVLLTAFRNCLVQPETPAVPGQRGQGVTGISIDRIVGPGYVMEVLSTGSI